MSQPRHPAFLCNREIGSYLVCLDLLFTTLIEEGKTMNTQQKNKNMATKSMLAAVVALTTVWSIDSIAATVDTFRGSGATANLFLYVNQDSHSSLTVNQDSSSGVTFIDYHSISCTYTETSVTCDGESASGNIPNKDFTAAGSKARLNIDVSTATSLSGVSFSTSCDITTSPWTCTRTETPSAYPTSLEWDRNYEFTSKTNGTSQQTSINYKTITKGQSTLYSANVSGTLWGTPLSSNTSGNVGTTTDTSIQITKLK